jgi:elongation factor Ts
MTITVAQVKALREATGAGPLDCQKALQANGGDFEKAATFLREKGLASATKKAGRETKAGLVVVKSSADRTCAVEVGCETDFVAFTGAFKTFTLRAADQLLANASLTDAEKLLTANFIDSPEQTTAEVVQGLISKLGENIVLRQAACYASGGVSLVEGYIHAGDVEGNYGPLEGRIGVLIELAAEGATSASYEALKGLPHALALHIAASSPRYLSPQEVPAEALQKVRDDVMASLAAGNKPDAVKAKIMEGQLEKFRQETCLLKQAFVKDESLTIESLLQQKSKEIGVPISIKRFARFEVGA